MLMNYRMKAKFVFAIYNLQIPAAKGDFNKEKYVLMM